MTCKVLSRFRDWRLSRPITCWWWAIKERVGIYYGVFQIQFHLLLSNWILSCVYMNLDASFIVHWPLLFVQISLFGWIWYCAKGIPLISSLILSSSGMVKDFRFHAPTWCMNSTLIYILPWIMGPQYDTWEVLLVSNYHAIHLKGVHLLLTISYL